MVSNRTKYDERRREFRQHQPEFYCPHCTSILYARDEDCLECATERPPSGWSPLNEGFDPCLGRILGDRYLVTRFLGVGGTGNVYRAESLTILRQFAIKIIDANREKARGGPEKIRSRLEREIEALSRLRNPHIVPFYEVLELPGNFLGVVMDYVEGTTLENLVHDEGPLSITRTCKIARQIAIGVHEAHEAGMTHRDLKPENVMIERLPLGDEFAHILDFGIVQLGGDNARMTQGFLGTPLYASPEQAMGREVDRRSDIYSLGAMLFFVLTGRPPFIGTNSFEVLDAHIRTPAPGLAAAYPERDYPPTVQTLVARMLSKAPDDRPSDLSAVIGELDAIRGLVAELTEPEYEASGFGQRDSEAEPESEEVGQTARGRPGTDKHLQVPAAPSTGPPATGELPLMEPETGPLPGPPKAEILKRGGSASGKFARPGISRSEVRRTPSVRVRALRATASSSDTRSGTTALDLIGPAPTGHVQHCAPMLDGRVVVVDRSDVLWVMGPKASDERQRLGSVTARVTAMATFRSGVLVGREDGALDHITFENARKRQPFDRLTGDAATSLAVDPAGQLVIIGTRSGRVLQGRGLAGKRALKLLQNGPRVSAVAVNVHGDTFAVGFQDGPVDIYTVSTPHTPFSSLQGGGRVSQMAFSKDGHIIALVLAEARTVHLHHVFTGHRLMSYAGSAGRLVGVRFTNDNELIGLSTVDGSVYSWDLQSTMVALPR